MASRDRSPQAQFFPRFCEENEECTPLKGPRAQVRSPGRMNKGVVGRPGGKNSARTFGIEEVIFSATLLEAPGFHLHSGRLSPHPLEVVPSKDDSAHFAKKRLGETRRSPGEER